MCCETLGLAAYELRSRMLATSPFLAILSPRNPHPCSGTQSTKSLWAFPMEKAHETMALTPETPLKSPARQVFRLPMQRLGLFRHLLRTGYGLGGPSP